MAGVIEHIRPPRCPNSGGAAEPFSVQTQGGAYKAVCPKCGKELWLNKWQPEDPTEPFNFTFPEHIGVKS